MRLFSTTAAVSALATLSGSVVAENCPTLPISGPFALTVVPKNGQGPWQTNLVAVSRGVPVLNTVDKSNLTFTWDDEEKRLHPADKLYLYSGKFSQGQGIYFTSEGGMPEDGQWLLEQSLVGCAVYLVKEGYTGEDVYQWSAQPPNASWTQPVYYAEPGSGSANVAVRIDLE